MSRFAFLLALMVAAGDYWHVTFRAHPENVAIVVLTRCRGTENISGYTWVPIRPEDTSARARRVYVPPGGDTKCYYEVQVMRRGESDGPAASYVGETGGL